MANELADWWRSLQGEPDPEPPEILTKAQAVQRVLAYAAANGLRSGVPMNVKLERRLRNHKDPQAGFHYVYTMALGPNRPGTFVDIAATDGTVLSWRALPR